MEWLWYMSPGVSSPFPIYLFIGMHRNLNYVNAVIRCGTLKPS